MFGDDQDIDLLDLLMISRDLGATDPRDKIYALLGLSSHEMIPDYEATPEHVFNEFALHVIGDAAEKIERTGIDVRDNSGDGAVRKALVMLSCAGTSNQNLELPSWVPDWTTDLQSRPLIFDTRFAAGSRRFEVDWHYESGLQLCGKLVDTIAIAGKVHLTSDIESDDRALIAEWWREATYIADSRTVRSPGSFAHLDAFRALCRDLSLCEHGYYRIEEHAAPDSDGAIRQSKRRASLLDDVGSGEDLSHNARQTLTLGPTRGRVLCVTTTGYLVLAPHGSQEGDLVYVVLGAPVPLIFRPRSDGAFTLVGEAYVQGIMDGELLVMDQWSPVTDIYVR